MATFAAEVMNCRKDGTYNVKIRIIHNRVLLRISTNIYADKSDLTRSKRIKSRDLLDKCDEILRKCRELCNELGYGIEKLTAYQLRDLLVKRLREGKPQGFRLDFFEYTKRKAGGMTPGSRRNYLNMLNSLSRYLGREDLDISEINKAFVNGYISFLSSEPSMRGVPQSKGGAAKTQSKGSRAVSLYVGCMRKIHNDAKDEFNNEEIGQINIPLSPFSKLHIRQPQSTQKRSISVDHIQNMINVPYQEEVEQTGANRWNLGKDCFLLSFALMGINSIDLYNADRLEGDIIIYNRSKTQGRRSDRAEMRVRIEPQILPLFNKYKDPSGERVFRFHKMYADPQTFNTAINIGLRHIGTEIGVSSLSYYYARHSFATIARNVLKVDKASISEMLNHIDRDFRITDIYIEKDWAMSFFLMLFTFIND